jgi:nucleosome binding factor SPN SPT16 subunit
MNIIVTYRRNEYCSAMSRTYVFTATVYTAIHITYSTISMNDIHVREGEHIKQYEDIYKSSNNNNFHNLYIYYTMILNVIININ